MDQAMGIPFKVSTTTSNFMIGVTAAASAGIYLQPAATSTPAWPCPSCSACCSARSSGARVLPAAKTHPLRLVFALVLVVLGLEMIYKGFSGRL